MELDIFWTDFSKKELKKIFDYYKEEVSLNVAKKLVSGITSEVSKLRKHPNNWTKRRIISQRLPRFSLSYF